MTDTDYIVGPRREAIKALAQFLSWFLLLVAGIQMRKRVLGPDDFDYSYYLGPDYRQEAGGLGRQGRVSKVVSNHVSFFDGPALLTAFDGDVSFVAGAFIKDLPGLGALLKNMGSVFVPRAGSKDQLEKTLEVMLQRTELIERDGKFPPLVIFPEGTCSNNTCLTKFRRGAFMDLK